ncbi:hypothetical protein B0H14DRAFT_2559240 [Mycena olivaceomarginata]|nr:hypothetical protein B0H14DRAFT_2559240 [Mycena olivaceomarginata]
MALPNFSFTTTAEEVATVLADEIRGKNVLITGTSLNGIGFETARVVAKYANLVIITGHNAERLNLAEGAIKNNILPANIRPLILDLSSLSAVRKAAAEINAIEGPLHAVQTHPKKSGKSNGHIRPFLLTKLLTPKILAARTEHYTPRVVLVSSVGYSMMAEVDFGSLARLDATRYVPKVPYYTFQTFGASMFEPAYLNQCSQSSSRLPVLIQIPRSELCLSAPLQITFETADRVKWGPRERINTFFSTRSTGATPEDGTYGMQALKQLLRLVGKSEVLTPSVKVRVNLKYASHGSGKHII